jgi:predicted nucleic acid-binding Zn finger protein
MRSGVRHQLASLQDQLEGGKLSEKDYRDVLRALEPISATADPAKLSKIYGSRFTKAWELLKEKRVKKYIFNPSGRVMWIVVGKEREYLIYPAVGYCGCDDFFFAVMDGKVLACQHLIAQRLAEELSDYDLVEAEDRLFDSLMEDKRHLMLPPREV